MTNILPRIQILQKFIRSDPLSLIVLKRRNFIIHLIAPSPMSNCSEHINIISLIATPILALVDAPTQSAEIADISKLLLEKVT